MPKKKFLCFIIWKSLSLTHSVKKVLIICKHNQRGIENSKDYILLSTVIPTARKCKPLVTAMCPYLGRTYVRRTYALTSKDITLSKPVSVSPCWVYRAIFVTCVINDCNHSLSVSPCRLVSLSNCDYFSAQSLAKWRWRIYIWNEIFHFKNRISGNHKFIKHCITSLHIYWIPLFAMLLSRCVGCKHIVRGGICFLL